MRSKEVVVILSAIALITINALSLNSWGAAETTKAPDDLADKYGNTLRPDDMQGFTKSTTLPSGINAEVKVIAKGINKKSVDEIIARTFSEATRIANLLDVNNKESDVSKVNNAAGKDVVPVSAEFVQIAEDARAAASFTDGSFNFVSNGRPSDLKIDRNRLTATLTKEGMKVNFDGILEGFLADTITTILYNASIENAMVTVGGVSRSLGQDVASNWRLLISDDETKGYAKRGVSLSFTNAAIATIGNGKWAPTNLKSNAVACRGVTLLAPKASLAEAIASGVYILGPEKGMSLIKKIGDVKGIIMDQKGDFLRSPGL